MKQFCLTNFFTIVVFSCCFAQTTSEADSFFIQKISKALPTVYSIAKHYNYGYQYILEYNQMGEKQILHLGDSIRIPLKKHFIHKVTTIDKSLWGIAQHYNIPVEDLKAYNFKATNDIYPGEQLVLPKAWTTAQYSQQFFNYYGKQHKLALRAIEDGQLCHYRLRWYRKRSTDQWVLVDELLLNDVNSIFDQGNITDFDQNKIPDILIVVNQGTRSYYTNYNLYVLDIKTYKIKAIKDFNHLNAPFYDEKTNSIQSIMGGPEKRISPRKYLIDYKNFELKLTK
jgi:LysM repeat protein